MSLQETPNEILTEVYDLLDTFSLGNVSQTSKQMRMITEEMLRKRKIERRKKKIIQHVLSSLSKADFETGLQEESEFHGEPSSFLDFDSYKEFTEWQIAIIENASEEDLFLWELMINRIIPNSDFLGEDHLTPVRISGFVFSGIGRIIFIERT